MTEEKALLLQRRVREVLDTSRRFHFALKMLEANLGEVEELAEPARKLMREVEKGLGQLADFLVKHIAEAVGEEKEAPVPTGQEEQ